MHTDFEVVDDKVRLDFPSLPFGLSCDGKLERMCQL